MTIVLLEHPDGKRDGWSTGFVEGAVWAMGYSDPSELRAGFEALVRRMGKAPVLRELQARRWLAMIEHVEAMDDDTQPITLAPGDANSPEGVGARGEPGGWSGLTAPAAAPPARKGRRR